MFGKVNGKSYCKLIVGRASLDVFIKYKNMLLLFLSRYFYARSKTDDFFCIFSSCRPPLKWGSCTPQSPCRPNRKLSWVRGPRKSLKIYLNVMRKKLCYYSFSEWQWKEKKCVASVFSSEPVPGPWYCQYLDYEQSLLFVHSQSSRGALT